MQLIGLCLVDTPRYNDFYIFPGLREEKEEYRTEPICDPQSQNIHKQTLYRKSLAPLRQPW